MQSLNQNCLLRIITKCNHGKSAICSPWHVSLTHDVAGKPTDTPTSNDLKRKLTQVQMINKRLKVDPDKNPGKRSLFYL